MLLVLPHRCHPDDIIHSYRPQKVRITHFPHETPNAGQVTIMQHIKTILYLFSSEKLHRSVPFIKTNIFWKYHLHFFPIWNWSTSKIEKIIKNTLFYKNFIFYHQIFAYYQSMLSKKLEKPCRKQTESLNLDTSDHIWLIYECLLINWWDMHQKSVFLMKIFGGSIKVHKMLSNLIRVPY